MNPVLVSLFVAAALFLWSRSTRANVSTNTLPVPPGPKPLPIIGNVFNLTPKQLWLRLTQWARQYGDVVYIHVFGQGLVFLNTYEVATDLLEKRGAIYSDKPPFVMAGELCGCDNMIAFTRYGDKSRRQRKLFNQALGATAVKQYRPLLQIECLSFIKRLLENPGKHAPESRRYAGGLTLLSIYGYQATSRDDYFLKLAEDCVDILANRIASGGGIWLVDVFPSLKNLPSWFPGAGFKRKAIEWKAKMEEFVDKPYEYVKERMREGTAVPCFVTYLLEEMYAQQKDGEVDEQREFDIRWTANSMYAASIDTTSAVLQHFLLQMLDHPEILKKAQKEIDDVVGTSRLPTYSDRPLLPYLEALMNEVLRLAVAVPMGLPHRLMEDDIYNGMFIPKGSLIFANIWNMVHNEEVYPDSFKLNPERYFEEADEGTKKMRDPRNYVFGFGRRRCPGSSLIEDSFWIVMAHLVATTDIRKAVDEQGNVIEPNVTYDNSVFNAPSPFQCDIRPRSEHAMKLLRETSEMLGA